MTITMTNIEVAKRYVGLVENPASTFEEIRGLMHDDLVWREMPNRFAPEGRSNSLAGVAAAWRKGREAVIDQVYEIRSAIGDGDTVVLELSWRGTMARDLGPFKAGTHLGAELATIMRFSHGKIISQTDYPCYHPIAS
jgi:ketosteroid isomerase-like protein